MFHKIRKEENRRWGKLPTMKLRWLLKSYSNWLLLCHGMARIARLIIFLGHCFFFHSPGIAAWTTHTGRLAPRVFNLKSFFLSMLLLCCYNFCVITVNHHEATCLRTFLLMFFNLDGWRSLIGAQNLSQHIVRRCLIWLHPRWWHTKELVQRAKHSKKTSSNLEDNLSSLKNTNKCELYADNRPNKSNQFNFQNSMDYGRIKIVNGLTRI